MAVYPAGRVEGRVAGGLVKLQTERTPRNFAARRCQTFGGKKGLRGAKLVPGCPEVERANTRVREFIVPVVGWYIIC